MIPSQTPAQRKWQARHAAEHAEMRRMQCGLLQFWRECRTPHCRRARRCKGDPLACFGRRWPPLPEPIKVWYRAVASALAAGASVPEALAAGVSEGDRFLDMQASVPSTEWPRDG